MATNFKQITNNLSQRLKREIRKFKNHKFNAYVEGLTNEKRTNYSLWKATKNLKRPIMQIPPIKNNDGN